jgi:NAD(P)-dependent dehydrogenase (short-subunit alcohol dehydrogenase family)
MSLLAVGGDLSEPGVADAMARRALDEFGQIDTLVNNAAALIRLRLIDFPEDLMQKAVRWNVWNTLRCCKAVLLMIARVASFASIAAFSPILRSWNRSGPSSLIGAGSMPAMNGDRQLG